MIIYYKQIFGEMCRRVGASLNKIDVDKNGWYNKYSWSTADERRFKDWLTGYFKKDKGAFYYFREIGVYPHNRYQCKLLADKLVKQYGWKIK